MKRFGVFFFSGLCLFLLSFFPFHSSAQTGGIEVTYTPNPLRLDTTQITFNITGCPIGSDIVLRHGPGGGGTLGHVTANEVAGPEGQPTTITINRTLTYTGYTATVTCGGKIANVDTPVEGIIGDIEVSYRPDPVLYNTPELTFFVSKCDNRSSVSLNIKPSPFNPTGMTRSTSTNATETGSAQLTIQTGGIIQPMNYEADIRCGSEVRLINFGIMVPTPTREPGNNIKIELDPANPIKNTKFNIRISMCPPNEKAVVEYKISGYNPFPVNLKEEWQLSGEGVATKTVPGVPSNGYTLFVTCGGKTAQHTIVLSDQEPEGPTPTQPNPPPPSPACVEYGLDGGCRMVNTALGPLCTQSRCLVMSLFTLILSMSGGIALLIIIYAGYLFMMSRGNPEMIKKAREWLVSAIVGLLFIIFSFVIFQTITNDLLNLPGFIDPYVGPAPTPF